MFNSTYSELLDALQKTMTSASPEVFYQSTGLMNRLAQLAAVLRNAGTVSGTKELPGPTFEYLPPDQRAKG